jgi:nucleoid DNA-binding protein
MTRADFETAVVEALAARGITAERRAVGDVINTTLDVITEELSEGNAVQFTGFGTFKVSKRAPRMGRNPRTGEAVEIPASQSVKFTPGKTLKEALN